MKNLISHLDRDSRLLAEKAKLETDLTAFQADYQRQLQAGDTSDKAIRGLTAIRTQIDVSEARQRQIGVELQGSQLMICAGIEHDRDALLAKLVELFKRRREQVERLFVDRLGCTPKDAAKICGDIIRRHGPPVFKTLARVITAAESISANAKDATPPRERAEALLRIGESARADELLATLK